MKTRHDEHVSFAFGGATLHTVDGLDFPFDFPRVINMLWGDSFTLDMPVGTKLCTGKTNHFIVEVEQPPPPQPRNKLAGWLIKRLQK